MCTPLSIYCRCKYIKYYRNLCMACIWLGKLHAFSRYNSNFQCDTKKNNQNGMKIVPIAYAICYTKITMNEKNTTERKIIKKCEQKTMEKLKH